MTKNKIKLSLIEDYIKIAKSEILCAKNIGISDDDIYIKTALLSKKLKSIYLKLFEKIGLLDHAFTLLNEELYSIEVYHTLYATMDKYTLSTNLHTLTTIFDTLNDKIKDFSLMCRDEEIIDL
ncbi:MAG: hypothetical protein E7351_00180 [Clostridiales bacterium]|nr:hypothetical protein [Clostridiales bacterium]